MPPKRISRPAFLRWDRSGNIVPIGIQILAGAARQRVANAIRAEARALEELRRTPG